MTDKKRAAQIVDDLIGDLTGRQGFDYVWDDCAKDIRTEIKRSWRVIVLRALEQSDD